LRTSTLNMRGKEASSGLLNTSSQARNPHKSRVFAPPPP
jgi:hypothetical protein